MSQLNIYISDDIEKQIREAAKKKGTTLSAFLASIIKKYLPEKKNDKKYFSNFFGKWEGDFPQIPRSPSQKRDDL